MATSLRHATPDDVDALMAQLVQDAQGLAEDKAKAEARCAMLERLIERMSLASAKGRDGDTAIAVRALEEQPIDHTKPSAAQPPEPSRAPAPCDSCVACVPVVSGTEALRCEAPASDAAEAVRAGSVVSDDSSPVPSPTKYHSGPAVHHTGSQTGLKLMSHKSVSTVPAAAVTGGAPSLVVAVARANAAIECNIAADEAEAAGEATSEALEALQMDLAAAEHTIEALRGALASVQRDLAVGRDLHHRDMDLASQAIEAAEGSAGKRAARAERELRACREVAEEVAAERAALRAELRVCKAELADFHARFGRWFENPHASAVTAAAANTRVAEARQRYSSRERDIARSPPSAVRRSPTDTAMPPASSLGQRMLLSVSPCRPPAPSALSPNPTATTRGASPSPVVSAAVAVPTDASHRASRPVHNNAAGPSVARASPKRVIAVVKGGGSPAAYAATGRPVTTVAAAPVVLRRSQEPAAMPADAVASSDARDAAELHCVQLLSQPPKRRHATSPSPLKRANNCGPAAGAAIAPLVAAAASPQPMPPATLSGPSVGVTPGTTDAGIRSGSALKTRKFT